MSIPDLSIGGFGGAAAFPHGVMEGTTDVNQMALDLMGEGMRFADGNFDATHIF